MAGTGGVSGAVGLDGGPDGSGAIATAPFDCGSRDVTGATEMSGTVSATATWSGVIHVVADLSVRNQAVITIVPGTKIIVAPGVHVEFGALSNDPTILAQGTPEAPITFCGEAGAPGYWSGLAIHDSVRTASVFRNVLVADAGANGGTTAASGALMIDAPVLLEGVQVRGSGGFGVQASTFAVGSQKLIVKDAVDAPLALTALDAVETIPRGSDFTGNGKDQIELLYSDSAASVHFVDHGVPYHQRNDVQMAGNVDFEAGVTYRVANQKTLSSSATTTTSGTAQSPVAFQGDSGGFGNPGRLSLRSSSLSQTIFSGLGGTQPGLTIEANDPVTLDHVSLTGSLVLHAQLASASGAVTIYRDPIAPTPQFSRLIASASALLSLPADTSLPNPGVGERIVVDVGNIQDLSGTIPTFGIPYFFQNGLAIAGTSNVNVAPGTTLMFPAYPTSGLTVDASAVFHAVGTQSARISFTGLPQAGGQPPATWQGIDSSSSNVTLNYVDVTRGGFRGASTDAANIVARSPMTLSNATVTNSGGWGLLKASSDSTNYSPTNTFSGNALGDIGTLP